MLLFVMPVALVSLFALTAPAKASLPVEGKDGFDGNGTCMAASLSAADQAKLEAYDLYFDDSGYIKPSVTYTNSVDSCPEGMTATSDGCCCVPNNN